MQLLELKRERKRGLMQQLLTGKVRFKEFEGLEWSEVELKSLADETLPNSFIDGDWIESPYIVENGVRLIQTGNIDVGAFKNKNKRYISEQSFVDLKCKEVSPGDVLVCRLAEPAGRACIVPDLSESRMITSVDVTIMKPNRKLVDPYYLVQFMSLPQTLNQVESLCGGSTRSRVSRSNLAKLSIHLPDLSEQQKISTVLSAADTELETLETQLSALRTQKRGLMQQLLTGKTRVSLS